MLRLSAFASLFALAGLPAVARAQVVVVPAEPGVVYYYPAPAYPAAPVSSYDVGLGGGPVRYPRLRRAFEVLADPTLLLPPNSKFASGDPPSPHPYLDGAPNVVNLASIGLLTSSSATANALAFGLPPAIRLARVALVGPPDVAETRRDTLLWVLSPEVLWLRNRRRDRNAAEAQQTVMTPGVVVAAPCEPPHRRRLFGRWR